MAEVTVERGDDPALGSSQRQAGRSEEEEVEEYTPGKGPVVVAQPVTSVLATGIPY